MRHKWDRSFVAVLVLGASVALTGSVYAAVIRVDGSLMTNGDGSSWALAMNTLPGAIASANLGDEIWVKSIGGAYTPGTTTGSTFLLKDGVNLYGGFAGTETNRVEADPYLHPTILSGDVDNNDDPAIPSSFSDNATNVVTATNTIAALTRLDGFIITKGRSGSGAGLRVDNTNNTIPTIVKLNVTRCRFIDNDAESADGGAVALIKTSTLQGSKLNVAFTNCEFVNNAAGRGGAIYFEETVGAVITNSLFVGNTATGDGGGIYMRRTCDAADGDCERALCSPTRSGVDVNSCTFFGNITGGEGGAAWIGRSEAWHTAGSIFWQNEDGSNESTERQQIRKEFYCEDDDVAEVTVISSCVEGLSEFAGYGNIGNDPDFEDGAAGDFRLKAGSPCIDKGAVGNFFPSDDLDFDGDGLDNEELAVPLDVTDQRVLGAMIDMDPFEKQLFEVTTCPADCVTSATFAPPPDGTINGADISYLLGAWGACPPPCCADTVNNISFQPPPDGVVDAADLAWLLNEWGDCEESFMESGNPYENTEIGDLLDELLEETDPEEQAALIEDLLDLLSP